MAEALYYKDEQLASVCCQRCNEGYSEAEGAKTTSFLLMVDACKSGNPVCLECARALARDAPAADCKMTEVLPCPLCMEPSCGPHFFATCNTLTKLGMAAFKSETTLATVN
jgi:hypothetical protein